MLRKYCTVTLSTAAQRKPVPTVAVMKGQMMYSPDPTPSPARMTLGPSTLPSGSGSGMSRYGIGGRLPFRVGSKKSGESAPGACRLSDHGAILVQLWPRTTRITLKSRDDHATPDMAGTTAKTCFGSTCGPRASAMASAALCLCGFTAADSYRGRARNCVPTTARRLARLHNVVLVSMNHRLNVFGFLDLSQIGGEKYASSGNAGMLDLVLALEWVRDNVAQLRRRPGSVTIFGQSGGGRKVSTLLGDAAAKGLFHKAAVLSGSHCGRSRPMRRRASRLACWTCSGSAGRMSSKLHQI